jgi:hypothetical protein
MIAPGAIIGYIPGNILWYEHDIRIRIIIVVVIIIIIIIQQLIRPIMQ